MTELGLIHILSALYLSGVFCLALSVFENNRPKRIVRETLRRWGKFVGAALLIALVVWLAS